MLRSLRIENFQSHKDTLVQFSPHLTIIVGENNSGKSAIFRSVSKVARNIPEGTGFVRFGEREVKLTLTTDQGVVVRAFDPKKGTPGNQYFVNGMPLTGFGREVPLEVKPVVGMSDVVSFTDTPLDLNFQRQTDRFFLISHTGSVRGKILGKVAGVDVVGRKQQVVTNRLQEANRELKRLEEEKRSVESELEKYKHVDDWIRFVKEVRERADAIQKQRDRTAKLGEIRDKLQLNIAIGTKINTVLGLISQPASLSTEYLRVGTEKLQRLREVQSRWEVVETRRWLVDMVLKATTPVEHLTVEPLRTKGFLMTQLQQGLSNWTRLTNRMAAITPVTVPQVDLGSLGQLQQRRMILGNLLSRWVQMELQGADLRVVLTSADEAIEDAVNDLDQLKKELGVCPTCQRPF